MPPCRASKRYILLKELPPNVATSPKLYAATADRSRIMVPFLQFLTASLTAQPKKAQRPRHVRVALTHGKLAGRFNSLWTDACT